MPSPVPTPVAAALGLVPTVLNGVRRLPGRAVSLPIVAISSALAGLDHARREYDDLAQRGERLLARVRGTSFDELEDRVEDRLQGTPLARPYDAAEDALEDAGEAAARAASKTVKSARARVKGGTRAVGRTADGAAGTVSDLSEKAADRSKRAESTAAGTAAAPAKKAAKATRKAAGTVEDAAQAVAATAGDAGRAAAGEQQPVPEAEQPKGAPTPKATQPDDTPVDTAATPDVVETVEQVAERTSPPQVLDHDALPLPDYDHMTLGSLRGRLRSLTVDELVQVRDYEKAHANRLPVVTMLDNRIAKLATDPSATPSGSDPTAVAAPEKAAPAKGGSKVSPATGGPAQNPPSQGVPTNPAQPRTTGSPGTNPSSNA